MEKEQQRNRLEGILQNVSIIENAPEILQEILYNPLGNIYSENYAKGGNCNCHSKCQSGSHSKSRSTASSYAPKTEI